MTKFKIVGASLLATGMFFAGSTVAFAENEGSSSSSSEKPIEQRMTVRMEKNGNAMLEGSVTAISGNTLSVASWGGTWSVDLTGAKLERRFGGESNASEFVAGDMVTVRGTASKTALSIVAKSVRNESVQTRNAVFGGTVSAFNATSRTFSLATEKQGTIAVTVASDAKFSGKKEVVTFADLKDGMRVNIRGVWDRAMKTVLAKMVVVTKLLPTSTTATTTTTVR